MRAGALRHKVTFQQRKTAPDDYGQQSEDWFDVATGVWAAIEPTTGRELLAAQAVQNESRYTITTRIFAGFDPTHCAGMRILFKGRIFNILDTSNIDERSRELQFACSEGLSKG